MWYKLKGNTQKYYNVCLQCMHKYGEIVFVLLFA